MEKCEPYRNLEIPLLNNFPILSRNDSLQKYYVFPGTISTFLVSYLPSKGPHSFPSSLLSFLLSFLLLYLPSLIYSMCAVWVAFKARHTALEEKDSMLSWIWRILNEAMPHVALNLNCIPLPTGVKIAGHISFKVKQNLQKQYKDKTD